MEKKSIRPGSVLDSLRLKKYRGIQLLGIFLLCSLLATAQQLNVSGVVTDPSGAPLPGVNVFEAANPTAGVITNYDGEYAITVSGAEAQVTFSFIGYTTQIIDVAGRSTINVTLSEEMLGLDEVVVVGFGTQKKVNVTGAVSSVDTKVLESRPVQNVAQALQGVVPGLNFSQNNGGGALDNTLSVNIRGSGTIGAGSSSSPLILIDGVEGNMNAINPADIENISVLKDAASAAIYGSRASFGVILITTKTGKAGRTKVNYGYNLRLADAAQIPEMMDSWQFATYFNEAASNSGQGAVFAPEVMDRIEEYQKWQKGEISGSVDGTTLNPNNNRWNAYTGANANTDWFAEMYNDWVPSHEHNLSMSGGTEKVTYVVSSNFLDQRGLINHGKDEFNRYSLNGRINANLTEKIKLNYSNKWIREEYERPSYMTGLFFHNIARRWPTNPVRDPNGYYMEGMEILQMRDGGVDRKQTDYLYQQVHFTFEPIENMKINAEGNYNTKTVFQHWDVLPIYGHDGDGNPFPAPWRGGDAGSSSVAESAYKENLISTNLYADYFKQFDSGHYFKVLAGANVELMKTRNVGGSRKDLITPDVPTINTATNETPSLYGGYAHWSTLGFFGRVNYNYMEKYLFEANIRRDGTSRFIDDKTWGTFPSFSAGWNIAREDFFSGLSDKISSFKLRASWGQLGNMNTNAWYPFYQTMPIGVGSGSWLVDGKRPNNSRAPGIVSALMTWETIESWDVGLDWIALNGRFTGVFDVFKRTTKDMIGPAPELSSILGTGVPRINNADMESYGWELELQWRDRIGDFSYGAKLALSDDQQKVTRYPNDSYALGSWYSGRMHNDIWGYTTVGIAKSQAEMDAHLAKVDQSSLGSQWAAGDIMYADIDGDGEINTGAYTLDDHGDLSIIGNSSPRYKFGITLDAAWKGFDMSMFWQGVAKRDYALGGPYFWGASGGMWQSAGFKEHWDFFRAEDNPLGANLNSYYPRPLFTSNKNQRTQSRYLQDASYMRLKNIQLGYTLPKSLTDRVKIQSVRFYVSADNLLTFSDITGVFDPELLGGDWGAGKLYPLSKTISMGVNVNF
ncbi:TonB-linked outer membrane protein, SusC/RagA family [Saccharicrinis carchari]|uniref:TonB-linked outer membrane protein, SusC/RagA family n=1 Tax=Saccharicrinis carchari TaxID=1168039 RepID=A0A521B3C7_SACCC|nr:TonB-dependent receptor [Saccharicrinis carchari]SMO41546.1 TonB-linked outer membrane protein, SusC/RagA family [Saccharicrinis carchari]